MQFIDEGGVRNHLACTEVIGCWLYSGRIQPKFARIDTSLEVVEWVGFYSCGWRKSAAKLSFGAALTEEEKKRKRRAGERERRESVSIVGGGIAGG